MQRLYSYLPRLSRSGLASSVSPFNVQSKHPLPSSSLGVIARLMSSAPFREPPSHLNHVADAVGRHASGRAPMSPDSKWASRSMKAIQDANVSPPADAYAGRSVKNTGNLALTFRTLNEILMRNKVRQTVRMSERHEKKGAKRRRLQSERWRKQFSNEVRKKVQLVIKIRDRGA